MNLPSRLALLERSRLVSGLAEAEPAYAFKHALVQQTAYESMLVVDRRDLHRRVGEALELQNPDRRSELAEVLGSHFEQAGESGKALEYLTLAAENALRRFATAEAAVLFGRAIDLASAAGADDDHLLALYRKRGRALELGGEYASAIALYRSLQSLGEEREKPKLVIAGVIGEASLYAIPTPVFDPARAIAQAERALELSRATNDAAGQARAYWLMMLAQTRASPQAAVDAGEASLDLARRHGLREQEAFTLNDIQANYQLLGRPDRALQALEEARPIWTELDNLPMLADNLSSTAMLHIIGARHDLGIERAREAVAISERIGNLWGQSYARVAIALAGFARGELGWAIRESARSIELSEQAGFIYPQVALRAVLSIALGMAGDLGTAALEASRLRAIEAAHSYPGAVSGKTTQAWVAVRSGDLEAAGRILADHSTGAEAVTDAMLESPIPLVLALCEFHLARKDYARALEVASDLEEGFERAMWLALRGQLLLTRARALRGLGRRAEGEDALQDTHVELKRQGVENGLWEVEAELAGAAAEAGRHVEAADLWRSAALHLQALAADLADLGLAQGFLEQPHVRRILDQT